MPTISLFVLIETMFKSDDYFKCLNVCVNSYKEHSMSNRKLQEVINTLNVILYQSKAMSLP